MARPHLLIPLVAFLASLGALAGCRAAPAASANGVATVDEVTDGDTIQVSIGGHHEAVRFLGIDTSNPANLHPGFTQPREAHGGRLRPARGSARGGRDSLGF